MVGLGDGGAFALPDLLDAVGVGPGAQRVRFTSFDGAVDPLSATVGR
jgi:hypothetical protein